MEVLGLHPEWAVPVLRDMWREIIWAGKGLTLA